MNGNGIFNGQILVDKLAKLNSSQQSIETLSHWCIFHMKKARQVVETWERQFHCSPRDQRVSYLYLANDILQNSRRKGLEFVDEFWKVLPNALIDVIKNGDDSGKKAALRLVDIWEERKVFGSHGQALKEEVLGSTNRNGKANAQKLRSAAGGYVVEKIRSHYEQVNNATVLERVLFAKGTVAMGFFSKLEKEHVESGPEFHIGNTDVVELRGHHEVAKEYIEQLKLVKSSRAALLSVLREAIHEQEVQTKEHENQIQIFQSKYEQIDHLLSSLNLPLRNPPLNEQPSAAPPASTTPEADPTKETSAVEETTASESSPNKKPKTETSSVSSIPCYVPQQKTETSDMSSIPCYVPQAKIETNDVNNIPRYVPQPKTETSNGSSIPCYVPQPLSIPFQPLQPPLLTSMAPMPPPFTYGLPMPSLQIPPPYNMVGMPLYQGISSPYNFQGAENGAVADLPPVTKATAPPSAATP